MEETKEQQSLYRFLQMAIYFTVLLELILFLIVPKILAAGGNINPGLLHIADRLASTVMYRSLMNSKLFTLLLLALVTIGTLSRKNKDLDPKKHIGLPLSGGLLLFFGSTVLYGSPSDYLWYNYTWMDLLYVASAISGTILMHIALDNVSKIISSNLGKDKWNVEQESFMQATKPKVSQMSVNIPTLFYYKKRVHKGFLVIENVARGLLLVGTPGSGKSWSIINPYIKQLIAKELCLCIYDFKFPDLGKVAYHHYLLAKQNGKCEGYGFHVVNLTEIEKSRRINPLRSDYIKTLADASETAEALVEALKKGDKSGGSDQFFTQSAVNFLASCIYFFSRYEDGKYSSLPHVLSFLNMGYEDIFRTLFSEKELTSLLSPFASAFHAKAFEQLEGQVGTLKIFISRLATIETFWVFSHDDFNLKISDKKEPGILILANDPNTQNINSACYSVVINRLTRLINSKGNNPSGIVVDESPTLYIHLISSVLATARSNKVAIALGLQELPQMQQQYGKDTANTIASVVGNVLAGSVRNKETLEWLERIFGKVKQESESLSIDRTKTSLSLSERLEPLIPAGKIASLGTGEIVGILAQDAREEFTGKFETSAVNCKVNLDVQAIQKEETEYRELPLYYDFKGKKDEILRQNFDRINREVMDIVSRFKPKLKPSDLLRQPGTGDN
ncbi:type IV secretory system conjugative DNA transfer family protein [Sphingobacterium lactis]|uniref:type IV secretory system conjugative DNA transfer family protein n=1 Tax=Sphingobacterium TaxID=28453 RepID=UPI0021A78482|nr:type IV secretory system conjugative DNA transfer family protein [Sphingobacterium hotanense]MCT1525826.1 type IV secretion system DNA-binding domain-containing protein [Sphingobacterium hotanense]